MRGLEKRFIEEAGGDFKLAWKLQKASQEKGARQPSRKRAPRETVVPTPGGGEVTSGRAGGLRAFISAHTVIKYDEEQTGMILRGFFDAMRADLSGQPDLSTFAPPDRSEMDEERWRRGAQERELGREIWRLFGKALLFFKVAPEEMARAYDYSVRGIMPSTFGTSVPTTPSRPPLPASVPAQQGAWTSPLAVPSTVNSAFDAKDAIRGNEYHRGVDLRAADGTPVVAPFRMMVRKVFEEQEGGTVVKATAIRPDGVFPDIDYNSQDDTGFILTFAHLQRVLVPENTVVEQGQQFAESGHSGTAQNGPHLHFAVEYVIDRTFPFSDMRIFVNPEALIPRAVVDGSASARPVQANTAASALIMPRTDDAAKALGTKETQIGQVIFNGDGTLVVNGTAVPVNLKPVLHLSNIGAGGDLAFPAQLLPPEVKNAANDLLSVGKRVVSGVADMAGHAFEVLTSKDGVLGLSNVLSAATNGLAAALGIAGPAASLLGPALSAIPYAGPFLTAAAEIGGPIASIAAPIVGALGGMANVGGKVFSNSTEASSAELANHLGLNLSANRQA